MLVYRALLVEYMVTIWYTGLLLEYILTICYTGHLVYRVIFQNTFWLVCQVDSSYHYKQYHSRYPVTSSTTKTHYKSCLYEEYIDT